MTSNINRYGPPSPCIGHCELDKQDMCMGCFRMLDDITGWRQKTPAEKQQTLDECEIRRQQHDALKAHLP